MHDISAVNAQLNSLREQLTKTNEDIVKHIEKRDKLNEQARNLRTEIGELKKERDHLNETVKTLKAQRDEIRGKIKPFIDEIRVHSEKIRELKEKRSGIPRHELQKQFDAIEWKIQTTSLDLKEEKRLIDEVKQIEIQLNVYKKMELHSQKISALKGELKALTDQADTFHKELTANAKKSQDIHATMQAKFEEMEKIRIEASTLHLMYLQAKGQIRPLHEEITRVWEHRQRAIEENHKIYEANRKIYEASRKQQDDSRKTLRERDENDKKAKENELKEKIGSQAKDKFERGEKVDWRELQLLLAGDDPESED